MWPFSSHKRRPVTPARRPAYHRPRVEALEERCVLSPGQLDPTFGSGGIVTTFIGTLAGAHTVLIQPDGKILAGGVANNQFELLRYTSSGSLDTSFGSGGEVSTTFSGGSDPWAMALYPTAGTANDGKIVLAGTASGQFALARYNPNGTLDTSFGNQGIVTTAFGSNDAAYAVLIQPDGKVIAAGGSTQPGASIPNDFALARYNVNGTLDTSFGSGGKVLTSINGQPGFDEWINGIALQSNGDIVAAGFVGYGNDETRQRLTVARYNSNGTLDSTFGPAHTGIAYTANGTGTTETGDWAGAVVLQPDGKILAAGGFYNLKSGINPSHFEQFAVARFNQDGSLDSTFGNGGEATATISGAPAAYVNDEAYAVALQPNGKIVLAGGHDTISQDPTSIGLARFNPDGSLDTSFNSTGTVMTTMSTPTVAWGVTFQPADGKIVVASGAAQWDLASGVIGVLRYQGDTTTFAVTGYPSPSTAGAAGTFTVTAEDFTGNVQAGYTGTIHFTSSDPHAVLPPDYTFTAADAGVHTFSAVFETAGSQSLTATDTANGYLGTETGITVTPAPASTLSVAGYPSPTNAGLAGSLTVTALDPYGNVATGYAGTVHFTSSDPLAALPADYTFTAADNGVHTFSATLNTTGTQSLTATDTATGSITGSQTGITVNPAGLPAATFSVSGFPSSTTAGVSGTITVTARDANGNVAPSYRGTVHFTSSDVQAGLPADYTFTNTDQGTHSFTVVLKTAGTQSVTATDTATSSITGTEAGIAVKPAAASQFSVSAPSSVTHGVAFILTVTALDPYGNVATGYTGTVKFSSSDSTATLPANYTFTTADAGVHKFVNKTTLRRKGKQTLTITDTLNNGLSATVTITVN
jgi:uncharacterized delta-60 repeat protein